MLKRPLAGALVATIGLASCTSKDDAGNGPAAARGGSSGSAGVDAARNGGGTSAEAGRGGAGGSAGSSNAAEGGDANASGTSGSPGAGGGIASAGRSPNGGTGGDAPGNGGGGQSAGTGGMATAGSAGEAGATGCTPSDEFDGTMLDPCWLILNGTASMPLIQIEESGGALHLSANGNQNGVWYQGATKSLVYQLVTSRFFTLTTTAHPRKATASDSLPTKDLHVGGVMVRDPSSNGGSTENYVFLMVGHSENNNGTVHQGVEFKSTVNGCSDWLEPDWGVNHDDPDAELRICRLGADFRMFKRVPGAATWTPAEPPSGNCSGNSVASNVLTRSDLPDTVEVGLALNFNAPSDLAVAFDAVHFSELAADATEAACTSD